MHARWLVLPLFIGTWGCHGAPIDHLRADIEKVDEPQFKAMFETSAEVLGGLVKAFEDYEKKNESAWKRTDKETRGVAFGP